VTSDMKGSVFAFQGNDFARNAAFARKAHPARDSGVATTTSTSGKVDAFALGECGVEAARLMSSLINRASGFDAANGSGPSITILISRPARFGSLPDELAVASVHRTALCRALSHAARPPLPPQRPPDPETQPQPFAFSNEEIKREGRIPCKIIALKCKNAALHIASRGPLRSVKNREWNVKEEA
jgi:hypothetical protein